MHTYDVFGVSAAINPYSYIDRGALDKEFQRLLERKQTHIAIRGASKVGKSWLRQKVLESPLTVQCRLGYTMNDIYRDALAQLDVVLEFDKSTTRAIKGKVKGSAEAGWKLIAKASGEIEVAGELTEEKKAHRVGKDINDLNFIASIIKESGRTLVIEDFHYLTVEQQTQVAFDLKTLWDYQMLVVVVGVWTSANMLISLNPDLAGRMEELSVSWQPRELQEVLVKGCNHLNLRPSAALATKIAEISYGSVGLLQSLAIRYIDSELRIEESAPAESPVSLDDLKKLDDAAMHVAEQQNQLYQSFATRVCDGIRRHKKATGIYAHAMAAVMSATDSELTDGYSANEIYDVAHGRQPRIQLGNLKKVLAKFPELQIDGDGRGLVLAYEPRQEVVSVVDRNLLLYRRYATVKWPWEELIAEVSEVDGAFDNGDTAK